MKPKNMIIKVAGLPGIKTQQTLMNTEEAVAQFPTEAEVEWISDIYKIARLGTVKTPSLFINDELKTSGRIPSVHEVKVWLEEARKN
ncbi:MAG: thioredoxin family protein [Ignavibacteriae bacterium]|nr:thioredoxin family protein [Ignavibacteriota bacterium]